MVAILKRNQIRKPETVVPTECVHGSPYMVWEVRYWIRYCYWLAHHNTFSNQISILEVMAIRRKEKNYCEPSYWRTLIRDGGSICIVHTIFQVTFYILITQAFTNVHCIPLVRDNARCFPITPLTHLRDLLTWPILHRHGNDKKKHEHFEKYNSYRYRLRGNDSEKRLATNCIT